MKEYTRANINNKNQKCLDYFTLKEYDTNYIQEGDILICSGDLSKKGYDTGENDFDTKDNSIIVLKSNDYEQMKRDALTGKRAYSSVVTIGDEYIEQGYVYLNFKRTENGVAYIHFTEKLIKKFNVTKEDAANLVNCLDSIKGSLIWVVFVDQMLEPDPNCTNKLERPENEIRVRLRSRFVEVNDIAKNYRGGGHLTAAGATIYSTKEKNKLLKELDEKLKNYKENNPGVL